MKVTQYFELLNYSEFGTEVNGQLYSCDLTEYPLAPSIGNHQQTNNSNSLYKNVRKIIDKRRGIIRLEETKKENIK